MFDPAEVWKEGEESKGKKKRERALEQMPWSPFILYENFILDNDGLFPGGAGGSSLQRNPFIAVMFTLMFLYIYTHKFCF